MSSLKVNFKQGSYVFHSIFNREYVNGGTVPRVSHHCRVRKQGTVHSQTLACYNSLVRQAQEQPSQPSHKEIDGTVEQRVHCLHWLFHAKICDNIFSS